jgi:hypothetical protein
MSICAWVLYWNHEDQSRGLRGYSIEMVGARHDCVRDVRADSVVIWFRSYLCGEAEMQKCGVQEGCMNRWVVGLRRPGHGTASNILYSNRKLYIFHESAMTEDVMAPYRRLTHSERARIHTLRYTTSWPCTQISRELQIPYKTVRRCTHEPITPTKPRDRPPLLNTPLRQRLISHATSSHEQRLKP